MPLPAPPALRGPQWQDCNGRRHGRGQGLAVGKVWQNIAVSLSGREVIKSCMGDKWLGIAPWSEALSIVFSPLRHGAASPSPNIENERGKPPPRGRAHCCSNMSLARRGIWNLGLAHPWQQLHPEHHCLLAPYFCMRNKNALLWRGKGRKKLSGRETELNHEVTLRSELRRGLRFDPPPPDANVTLEKRNQKRGTGLLLCTTV